MGNGKGKGKGKKDTGDALADLLGFNPVTDAATKGVLDEALKEVREERELAAKGKMKGHLLQLIEIARERAALDKEYEKGKKKFAKMTGKLMNQLQRAANGEAAVDDDDDAADDGGKSES